MAIISRLKGTVVASRLGLGPAGTPTTGGTQKFTATGTVTPGIQSIELNHASSAITATIASLANHQGFLSIKDTSASGTAAHKVTLTSGQFDASGNNTATLNAPGEYLLVYVDSAGKGTIINNTGSVALSTV